MSLAADPIVIDVREQDEFDAERVPDSIHVPLSAFETEAPAVLKALAGREVILLCRGGKRAAIAAARLPALGLAVLPKVTVFAGGLEAWRARGLPVVGGGAGGRRLPIMRQVLLVAGLIVLLGAIGSMAIHPGFVWVAVVAGAGLTVAGATGFCLMAELLGRAPWNHPRPRKPSRRAAGGEEAVL